jgi:penicillin-binding protein 1C
VATLDRLGPQVFAARLTAAGARLVRPRAEEHDAGLALALGGEGISLRDEAMLYAALADDGLAKPLAWTEADAKARLGEPGQRLMRPASARAILDILRDGPPPKGRAPDALTRTEPMAFKTGTSYGFRDAVAVGVAGGFVIAVWTGRADGGARPDLTGRDAALPLLFDVADMVGGPAHAPPPLGPKAPPSALRTLERPGGGPRLVFPPDGATVVADGFGPAGRGFILAAGGIGLTWYVNGSPVSLDPVSGKPIWRPTGPGFYRVSVVDADGRSADAHVRVTGG